MPVVDAKELSKSYGPHTVLDGVSLTIRSGERVGLVGVNGSGKSTLARILAGLEAPDGGSLAVRRGAKVVYLVQTPVVGPDRTAREEVMTGLAEWKAAEERYRSASASLTVGDGDLAALLLAQAGAAAEVERLGGWELEHRAEAILGHLGIERLDARVSTMSGGEQRRVGLARVLIAAPDLAILDEPTNHLDVETVEWLEHHLLESFSGALLLITHDRYVLDRVATRIIELDHGALASYQGGYEDYLEGKATRLSLEARIEANRQSFLRQELEWLRRQPKARTTKQKARIKRAEVVLGRGGPARAEEVHLSIASTSSGKTVLELHDLQIEVEGRMLVRSLDLTLVQGQRIGVIGRSGCGKTTLLRTIVGELGPAAGQVILGKNTRLSYLGQLRDGLDPQKSILDNVSEAGAPVIVGDRACDVRGYLDRFLFPPEKLRQPVGSLSGGERTRVALAKLLLQTTNLILLDEPANDLDLPTISALEQMLVEFDGTAIVVTHDRWFLDRVATNLLVFEGQGSVISYAGNYTTYRTLRAAREESERDAAADAATERRSPPRPARRRSGKPAAITYAERLELQAIVGQIEMAEAHVSELESRLGAPDTYRAGGQEVPRLIEELELAREEVARLTRRWEDLETKQQGAQ